MRTNNLQKWEKLLRETYGIKDPKQKEVFEFANTLTNFFYLLIKFNQEDKLKNDRRRNNTKS